MLFCYQIFPQADHTMIFILRHRLISPGIANIVIYDILDHLVNVSVNDTNTPYTLNANLRMCCSSKLVYS